ncbi:MAG: N-formylglutamate amidohydrolase [Rhodomicrobium sp.]|nr:MAG: N-formylglutamate amidohydrolase [Rhodomicrobium sp.]
MDAQEFLNAMRKLNPQYRPIFEDMSPHSDIHRAAAGYEPGGEAVKRAEAPGYNTVFPEDNCAPFVFNSPHSGRHYTPSFLEQSRLSPLLLRKSEDALVDQLFQFAPQLGAPLLAATFPRAYVDVNREPFELDPRLFTGPLPSNANDKSVRVAAGLGTIARVVGDGLEIYRHPLSLEEALWRITNFYLPYHRQLRQLIDMQLQRYETAILIDCHSMPSRAKRSDGTSCADIIIGDRFGTASHPDLVSYLVDLLKDVGLSVAVNSPYAGGYITEHYGRPDDGVHAIQVEINRSLYMDEVAIEPHSGFIEVSSALKAVFTTYIRDVTSTLFPIADAAE